MSLVSSRVVPILFALLSLSASSIKSSEIIKTLQELNPGPADSEASRFLLPKLAEKYAKYVPSDPDSRGKSEGDEGSEDGTWDEYVYDPKLFLLTETEEAPPNEENYAVDYRDKREALVRGDNMVNSFRGGNTWKNKGPSLSIVNPLDVLRQRLLLEIARRRQEKSQSQINENRKILTSLGKRSDLDRDGAREFQTRGLEGRDVAREFQASGRGDDFFTAGVYEPSESYSRWTSSLADFPRVEHRFHGHRNYNRHVN